MEYLVNMSEVTSVVWTFGEQSPPSAAECFSVQRAKEPDICEPNSCRIESQQGSSGSP